MDKLAKIETGLKPLTRVIAIIGALAGIGVGYWFVMDNIYRPKVTVVSVDYETGVAVLSIKELVSTFTKTLYAGSMISAGGHWGIRFASSSGEKYNRIELVKDDITYKVLNLSAADYPEANPNPSPPQNT